MFVSIYQQQKWVYYVILMMINNLDFIRGGPDSCDDLPEPANTQTLSGRSPPFDVGTKLTFECKRGYVDSNIKTTAECVVENDTAVWKIDARCNPVSCGFPGDVTNGRRRGELFTYAQNVTYECDPGYKMKGIAILFCGSNSQWTSQPPECKIVSCPRPGDVADGDVSYSTLTYRSEVNYSCKKGFVLSGTNKRRCQENGTWSGSEPQCLEVKCPEPLNATNGYFIKATNSQPGKYLEGDVIIYYCNSGNKHTISRCQGGMWSSLPPVCDVAPSPTPITSKPTVVTEETSKKGFKCSNLPKIEHGSHTLETDDTVSFKCDKGYRIKGSKTLTCLPSGKWDSNAPTCESGKLPIGYILGIVFGITALIAIVIGVSLFFVKRRKSQSPVKPSKASLNDAVNFEELQKLEKNHRPVPVTVL